MPFELSEFTKCRVLDVRVLAAKDRKPDDPPGGQLLLSATLPSGVLAMFDGFLPAMMFQRAKGGTQGKLDGMEGEELTGIGSHVQRLRWQYEQTGCSVEIDYGTGGKRNIILSDCKVHRVSISPREGGSVVVQWTVDAPGLSDATWAKLPNMKATDVQLKLLLPEVADDPQTGIEDPPTPKRGRKATATTGDASKAALDASGKSSFAQTPEQALAATSTTVQ